MKKIKKISLHNLSQAELQNREMLIIKGGFNCGCKCTCDCLNATCPCSYAAPDSHSSWHPDYYGGSSTEENQKANGGQSDFSIRNSTTDSSRDSNVM